MIARLALVLAALALACLWSGCDDDVRAPIPIIEITVLDDAGTYLLNKKRLLYSELSDELQKLSDEYRRPTGGTERAFVRIYRSNRVSQERVNQVVGLCSSLGLDKVTVGVREAPPSGK